MIALIYRLSLSISANWWVLLPLFCYHVVQVRPLRQPKVKPINVTSYSSRLRQHKQFTKWRVQHPHRSVISSRYNLDLQSINAKLEIVVRRHQIGLALTVSKEWSTFYCNSALREKIVMTNKRRPFSKKEKRLWTLKVSTCYFYHLDNSYGQKSWIS
jgi:hypothetical protein